MHVITFFECYKRPQCDSKMKMMTICVLRLPLADFSSNARAWADKINAHAGV